MRVNQGRGFVIVSFYIPFNKRLYDYVKPDYRRLTNIFIHEKHELVND